MYGPLTIGRRASAATPMNIRGSKTATPRGVAAIMALLVGLVTAYTAPASVCRDTTPRQIWAAINAVVDAPGGRWPVECVRASGINAYVDHIGHRVAVHGAVAHLSETEIAAILAHERAHLALGHPPPRGEPRRADAEAAADRLGVFFMRLAGYEPAGALDLLGRFDSTPADHARRRRLESDIAAAKAWIPASLDTHAARRLGVLLRHRLLNP